MKLRLRVAALLFLSVGFVVPVTAQSSGSATLRVHVTDKASGLPIAGAQAGFPDLKQFSLTDAGGLVALTGVFPGDHRLEVTMLGYGKATASVHLGPGVLAVAEVALSTDPIKISGITVEGRALSPELKDTGFYTRQKIGIGLQLDEFALDSLNAKEIGDVIVKRGVPRCMSFGLSGGPPTLGVGQSKASQTGPTTDPSRPLLSVYLDGVPITDFRALPGWTMLRTEKSGVGLGLDPVRTSSFAGVEYYNKPSEMPVAFRGDCAVLLLWTK